MLNVVIYTDGSCLGNPGVGGYAAILTCNGHELVVKGGEANTTNNKMELKAVIEALKALKKQCDFIEIISDSEYIIKNIHSVKEWRANSWINKSKKPVANKELWEELCRISKEKGKKIKFSKVLGHSGDAFNERCDCIAKSEAMRIKKEGKQ